MEDEGWKVLPAIDFASAKVSHLHNYPNPIQVSNGRDVGASECHPGQERLP